jgi:4-hydroxy-4-methyl-2-oxoglutarate aldolase
MASRSDSVARGDEAVDGLMARASGLTTCHISDALDRCGLPPGGLVGIRPLEPAKRAVGLAFPVQLRAADGNSADPRNYLDHIPPRAFVVLAAGGRQDCSVWGGNRSVRAIERGAAGAVADGAFRDVDEHRELGFPVYGLAPISMASRGRLVVTEFAVPVVACGVRVAPGDLVAADSSGVVVVPQTQAERVVTEGEHIRDAEAREFERRASRPHDLGE